MILWPNKNDIIQMNNVVSGVVILFLKHPILYLYQLKFLIFQGHMRYVSDYVRHIYHTIPDRSATC